MLEAEPRSPFPRLLAPPHQLSVSSISVTPAKIYNNIHKFYTKSPKSEVIDPVMPEITVVCNKVRILGMPQAQANSWCA